MNEEFISELIAEVAKKHHVLLDKSDPILVTLTLNELLLKRYISDFQLKLDEYEQSIAILQSDSIEASKKIASQLITESGQYMKQQFQKSVDEVCEQIKAAQVQPAQQVINPKPELDRLTVLLYGLIGLCALILLALIIIFFKI